MKEKFIDMLEGAGRPKKAVDPDAPVKEKGKPGRKKGSTKSEEEKEDTRGEGIRTVTLHATISLDGKKTTQDKVLKNIKTDDIKAEIDKWEKELHKAHNYDADITITKKIGEYEVNDSAEKHAQGRKDVSGSDTEEDESYSIGTK